VAAFVVFWMALVRAAVGDPFTAGRAVVMEVGLVPEVGLALEVLERGDGGVIAGLAVRALVQAEGWPI
jgi:hypothetical protein